MGQAPSLPVQRSGNIPVTQADTSTNPPAEKTSADPFHRSPISPTLLPTSFPPPTNTKVEARPSILSRRKTSSSSQVGDTNLPKPTIGERVVRTISKSRKGSAVVQSGPGPVVTPSTLPRLHPSEFGPSSYGRYPGSTILTANPKLSSSLGSSTVSGPSTSLVTPSGSRRNLVSPIPHLPSTPLHQIRQRPPLHRRGSSQSSSPSGGHVKPAHSPKTRTRAEREWRARVAAISAGTKARGGAGEVQRCENAGDSPAYKGPPPPRRRGGPQASISAAPAPIPAPSLFQSTSTVPHILVPDQPPSPPRHSLSSARSFETLGHHIHARRPSSLAAGSPSHVQYRSIPIHRDAHSSSPLSHHRAHSRKSSFPQSIGSFYADANNRGGTRPNSLAASTFLSPLKASAEELEVGVEEAADHGDEAEEEEMPLGMGAGALARTRLSKESERAQRVNDDELIFDMTIAPSSQTAKPSTSLLSHVPAQPLTPKPTYSSAVLTASRTPTRGDDVRHRSVELTSPPSIAFGQGPETPRSRARKERILSLPSIDTSPQRTPTRFALPAHPARSSTSPYLQADTSLLTDTTSPLPSLLSYTLSTPTPTRQSQVAAATPTTPHSPMTAYILSAPSIDLTFPTTGSVPASPHGWRDGPLGVTAQERDESSQGDLHPFASFLDAPSPPRAKGVMVAENAARRRKIDVPAARRDEVVRQQENRVPLQPVKVSSRLPAPTSPHKPLPHRSTISRSAHPLRPRTPNDLPPARVAILGGAANQERTRGKVVVDLCPGQGVGAGTRPPKRGMDQSVSNGFGLAAEIPADGLGSGAMVSEDEWLIMLAGGRFMRRIRVDGRSA